jgi:hypothetical protein
MAILSYSNYTLPVENTNYAVLLAENPRFVEFQYPDFFFHPVRPNHIGVFTIKGELYNDYTSTPFSFKVNVTNQAPYLLERQIADVKVPIKGEYTFNISEGVDREKQTIKYEAKERYK